MLRFFFRHLGEGLWILTSWPRAEAPSWSTLLARPRLYAKCQNRCQKEIEIITDRMPEYIPGTHIYILMYYYIYTYIELYIYMLPD